MGNKASCICSRFPKDEGNFLSTTDTMEQPCLDNSKPVPEDRKDCESEIQTIATPPVPQSPAIRSCSALQNLPVELLQEIGALLPPVYRMSLSYTCRRHRQTLNCSIAYVLKDPRLMDTPFPGGWASAIRFFKANRLELLKLLDRDGKISENELVCVACAKTHSKAKFSLESVHQGGTERACAGITGRVWLCPHFIFYHEPADLVLPRPFGKVPQRRDGSCEKCLDLVSMGLMGITTLPILGVSEWSSFHEQDVREVLSGLHAPICPHLRLSSPLVFEIYSRHCSFSEPNADGRPRKSCTCNSCLPSARCPSCYASIRFDEQVSDLGRRTLRVIISRFVEPQRRDPTCPRWGS